MDKGKVLEKIKKCLALSKSSNEHEAAQALKHAQKLMEIHGIDDVDIELSEITDFDVPCVKTFPTWHLQLLTLINNTFGCGSYQKINFMGQAKIRFYGFNGKAEIAGYAYDVLLRQIKQARLEFIRTQLKRVHLVKNKTYRADQYCEGWVYGAYTAVAKMKVSEQEKSALDKYLKINLKNPSEIKPRSSSAAVSAATTNNDLAHGLAAGKKAQLHNAVNTARSTQFITE